MKTSPLSPTRSLSFARFFPTYQLALALLLLFVSCLGCQPPKENGPAADSQSKGDSGAPSTKRYKIAVVPKGTTHVFWKSVHYGAAKAADEFGADILFQGPQKEDDRDQQISLIQSLTIKGVDGICLAPLDSEALVRPVEEAKKAGIPTVIFDSGLKAPDSIVSYVATDNYLGGQMAAEAMAKALNEKGRVIMLRYAVGSESTEQREEGFLAKIKEYPQIEVLSSDQYAGPPSCRPWIKHSNSFNASIIKSMESLQCANPTRMGF